jgi:hypothetical protein
MTITHLHLSERRSYSIETLCFYMLHQPMEPPAALLGYRVALCDRVARADRYWLSHGGRIYAGEEASLHRQFAVHFADLKLLYIHCPFPRSDMARLRVLKGIVPLLWRWDMDYDTPAALLESADAVRRYATECVVIDERARYTVARYLEGIVFAQERIPAPEQYGHARN